MPSSTSSPATPERIELLRRLWHTPERPLAKEDGMSTPGSESRLQAVVPAEMGRYFRHLGARVERAVHSLPREKLWIKPFPFGNSVGHLVLHLTGNLNHYIG